MNLSQISLEGLVFEWPWCAALLLLPLLARALPPATDSQTHAALRWPADSGAPIIGSDGAGGRVRWLRLSVALLAWLALVASAMRPQLPADAATAPVTGRNLMLAVDLSGSMNDKDFVLAGRSVERLTATKAVGGDFIDRRVGDRIGLILFGERAYIQAPLTFDRETVKTLLYEAMINFAGQKPAIGDAIALAVKRVREVEAGREGDEQVLILLTDGANTAGQIPPLKAAELAATVGLRIYTIGIGSDNSRRGRFFGGAAGGLDEKNLEQIAEMTGGRYFRARNTESLAEIYLELDQLEPAADEEDGFRARDELFWLPASVALLLAGLLCMPAVFRRYPA